MRLQPQGPWTKAVDFLKPRTSTGGPLPPITTKRRSAASWQGRQADRDRTLQLLAVFLDRLFDMPANKRGAPSTSETSAKKRKTDKDLQKYYAVRTGARPGIYLTWAECQAQTAGFRGAQYKSFLSREDAQAFVEGRKIPSASGSNAEPPKFYAVARGSFTGIFPDWETASLAIAGTKGPKYKKFDNRYSAVAFIQEWGDEETIAKVLDGSDGATVPAAKKTAAKTATKDVSVKKEASVKTEDVPVKAEPGTLPQIYTDGSSLGNGKVGSSAGVGVYFGPNDPRNVSERLEGELQTNQRAELTAILRALQATPVTQPVQILTDSQYSINCVTQWYKSWEKKEWHTSGGDEVKNKDLVQSVREQISLREASGTRTVFTWVKGHADNLGNVAADGLAVAGARMSLPSKGRRKLK